MENIMVGSKSTTIIIITEAALTRYTNSRPRRVLKVQRVINQKKINGMQRNRNRNIMVNNKDFRHITVTGFIGDNKGTPAKKLRNGQGKLKAARENVSAAKKEFNDAFDLAVKEFKAEASGKISQTEVKIQELKNKIFDTSKELGLIYQDHIDKLEYSKKILVDKLDEYKEIGAEDWNNFKHHFNDEVEDFETSVTVFLQHLKSKESQKDDTSA
jgi:hypothetical protein